MKYIFLLAFTVLSLSVSAQRIKYTNMDAAGYQFKYLKADSGLTITPRDTFIRRGIDTAGVIVYKPNAGFYGYNGTYWTRLGTTELTALAPLYAVNDSTIAIDTTSAEGVATKWDLSQVSGGGGSTDTTNLSYRIDTVHSGLSSALGDTAAAIRAAVSGIDAVLAAGNISVDKDLSLTTSGGFNSVRADVTSDALNSIFSIKGLGDSVYIHSTNGISTTSGSFSTTSGSFSTTSGSFSTTSGSVMANYFLSTGADGFQNNNTIFREESIQTDNSVLFFTRRGITDTIAVLSDITGGSNVGDSLVKAYDTLAAHNTRIGALEVRSDIDNEPIVNAMQSLGSTVKSTTVGVDVSKIAAAQAFNSNSVYYMVTWVPNDTTITGVTWYQTAQGNYTASGYNGVGLYSYSGGTWTLVASSTDDGNIWKATANTYPTKDFSSTYRATRGVYAIAFTFNRSAVTTAPTIGRGGVLTNLAVSAIGTNSAKLYSSSSGISLPSTIAASSQTSVNTPYYLGLY